MAPKNLHLSKPFRLNDSEVRLKTFQFVHFTESSDTIYFTQSLCQFLILFRTFPYDPNFSLVDGYGTKNGHDAF